VSLIRIAFLGTPEFARFQLESLIKEKKFQVVGVITQPDRPSGRKMHLKASPVKILAEEHKIPVLTPEKVIDVLEIIKAWRAEAAIVVAFGQILTQSFLDLFPLKVVNVHGSILPRWRGAAPIQRAIMSGDRDTGVSLQIMIKKLDAGDVLGTRELKISDNVDAIDLHDQMKRLGAELLHKEFVDYLQGHLVGQPQDESLVTYAHKLQKSEGELDWKLSHRKLFNLIRGMKLGPGCFTIRNGQKLKIHKAFPVEHKGEKPGMVFNVSSEEIKVVCGEGGLCITEVQPESKSKMQVKDYLKGYPIQQGDVLG